jgi:hypothetical protein
MVDGGKEVGLTDGNAQHGHLQSREPDTDCSRNAVFGEDRLEHHRHDLDRRALHRCGGGLFESLLALLELRQHLRRADRWRVGALGARHQALLHIDLGVVDRFSQHRRHRFHLRRVTEAGQLLAHQAIQPAEDLAGIFAAQRAGASHQPRLVADASRGAPTARAAAQAAAHRGGRAVARVGAEGAREHAARVDAARAAN